MKRSGKALLILAILIVASQVPFAYRRYKLGRLNAQIQMINSSRRSSVINQSYSEYKGVIHVHSFLGGHSTGSFSDIISSARSNQLDFVVMTEHPERDIDTAQMTLNGMHGGILFINGNEVSTADGQRLLIIPGDSGAIEADKFSAEKVVSSVRASGALSLAAYPDQFKNLEVNGLDGIEVFNVYSNARQVNPLFAVFDVLWSKRSYPALLFASFYTRPHENLKRWDEALVHAHLTGTAGNDSHANIGISLKDSSGKTLLGLQLDPYEVSFRLVRVHVLIPSEHSLIPNTLFEAIRRGHCFIAFDLFGDTTGFSFMAANADGSRIQGDEIAFQPGTQLKVDVPVAARVLILKDGQPWIDEAGVTSKMFDVKERGVYRVEVYLPQLGKPVGEQPWIISNPIFVK